MLGLVVFAENSFDSGIAVGQRYPQRVGLWARLVSYLLEKNAEETMPVPSPRAVLGALASLDAVYERAWAEVCAKGSFISDGESNREWLCYIILGLTIAGVPGDIANLAVDQFVATVPQLGPLADSARPLEL